MDKLVFLDRDGTINVEKDYLYRQEEFEFMPGVLEGLKRLQDNGYQFIIVTNQSGIARGYYTEEDYETLTRWMLQQFEDQRIHILQVYYCPHHPQGTVEAYRMDCDCRKPKLGMYQKAIQKYQPNLETCVAIGDKIRDCAICEQSLCRGFLIHQNEKPEIIQRVKEGQYRHVSYAPGFLECVEQILNGKEV